MTTYQAGDLVLAKLPFTGGTGGKVRPALVVLDTGDADVVVARVTTQTAVAPLDVSLTDWQASGLLAASVVRLHKLATIEKALVIRVLGQLQPGDRQRVAAVLQQTFGSW
jgi:mRNA interferase MazF